MEFLKFRVSGIDRHASDLKLLKSYFRIQPAKGKNVEACDKLDSGKDEIIQFGVQQVSAFLMARRLAQSLKDTGELPGSLPSGGLMFHSTGSGKTFVAALIFLAFYDVPWIKERLGLSSGQPYFRTHISHTGAVGSRGVFEFRDEKGGSFFGRQNRVFPGGFARPGSHRRVIYVTTQEGLVNNQSFPEKELKKSVMASMSHREIHDYILQNRGERFERITFDMLAAILFGSGSKRRATEQMDTWFKEGITHRNTSQVGGAHVVYNPYYLANATVIFDEAQNLFRPKSNRKADVARYKMLRALLTDHKERLRNKQTTLAEDPKRRPVTVGYGRTFRTCVYVLSATPGENERQLMELLNMMNSPEQYARNVSPPLDSCWSRISYVNKTQDTSVFPKTGMDYLHQLPLTPSQMEKMAKIERCKQHDDPPQGNKDVEKEMVAQYGKYFEHPALLRVDEETGLLAPQMRNGSVVLNRHYKGKRSVVAWREQKEDGTPLFTVKASPCDSDTLGAHGSMSMYRQDEKKHAAMSATGESPKLTRLRNVILRTPREKHFVYWGIGAKEVVVGYSVQQVASKVLGGQPSLSMVAKGSSDPEAVLRKHLASDKPLQKLTPKVMLGLIRSENPGFKPRLKKGRQDPEHIREVFAGLKPTGDMADLSPLGKPMNDQDVMFRFPEEAELQKVLDQPKDKYVELNPARLSKNGKGGFMLSGKPIEKAPRYGILCTIPKTRCENQKGMKLLVELFNWEANAHGEYLHVLFGAQKYNEGLDLKAAVHVHILTPPATAVDRRQTIGRSARFCSMKQLPARHRRTHVHNYIAVAPDGGQTVDHDIYQYSVRGDSLGRLEANIARMALDCEALKELHGIACSRKPLAKEEKRGGGLLGLIQALRKHFQTLTKTSEEFDKLEAAIQSYLPTVTIRKAMLNNDKPRLFARIVDS